MSRHIVRLNETEYRKVYKKVSINYKQKSATKKIPPKSFQLMPCL